MVTYLWLSNRVPSRNKELIPPKQGFIAADSSTDRETCTPANNPSAQTAPQILSSRQSLLCHNKTPSLFLIPQVGGFQRVNGALLSIRASRVSVSVGAKPSGGPALRGSRVVQVRLSLPCIFFALPNVCIQPFCTQKSTKKITQHPFVCLWCLL